MNEFIVWNKKLKKFLSYNDVNCMGGNITEVAVIGIINSLDECYCGDSRDLEFLDCIGKTDIEGNKIYADSSIVEFETKDNIYRGYFKYDEDYLRFKIVIDSRANGKEIDYSISHHFNFKIIGTLQENKELLT